MNPNETFTKLKFLIENYLKTNYNRYICLAKNENNKFYIHENDIFLTNREINLSELNNDVSQMSNAVSFEIAANLNLVIKFYYIKFDGFPHDTKSNYYGIKSPYYRQVFELLHIEDSGNQKIQDWLDYLHIYIGNLKNTPIDKIFETVHGVNINYGDDYKPIGEK